MARNIQMVVNGVDKTTFHSRDQKTLEHVIGWFINRWPKRVSPYSRPPLRPAHQSIQSTHMWSPDADWRHLCAPVGASWRLRKKQVDTSADRCNQLLNFSTPLFHLWPAVLLRRSIRSVPWFFFVIPSLKQRHRQEQAGGCRKKKIDSTWHNGGRLTAATCWAWLVERSATNNGDIFRAALLLSSSSVYYSTEEKGEPRPSLLALIRRPEFAPLSIRFYWNRCQTTWTRQQVWLKSMI